MKMPKCLYDWLDENVPAANAIQEAMLFEIIENIASDQYKEGMINGMKLGVDTMKEKRDKELYKEWRKLNNYSMRQQK